MPEPKSPSGSITGTEPPGDPRPALSQFYRAFNEGDLSLMEENWEHSDDVSAIPPIGEPRFGWATLRAGYARGFADSPPLRTEFFDFALFECGEILVAVGREREQPSPERPTPSLGARTTNIFHRATDGRWRLLHHHVSIDDPQQLAAVAARLR